MIPINSSVIDLPIFLIKYRHYIYIDIGVVKFINHRNGDIFVTLELWLTAIYLLVLSHDNNGDIFVSLEL